MKEQNVTRDFSNEDKTRDKAKVRLAEARIIKYNFWQPSTKTMHCWENFIEYGIFEMFRNDDSVPLQFTGLHDKNGKEIYEGDIVFKESINRNGFVRFDYGWAVDFSKDYSHDMPQYYCEHLEIIGNIYENPNLLAT